MPATTSATEELRRVSALVTEKQTCELHL